MNKTAIITGMCLFLIGWLASSMVATHDTVSKVQSTAPSFNSDISQLASDNPVSVVRDRPSPKERIQRDNVFVYDDQVILKIDNPEWAVFADTKSMDPVIDSQSKAIEITPKSPGEIQVGDIVAYESAYMDGAVAHRVIEIGTDSKGWFARMKGDNNENMDPEKVRFEQIKRVVVAIIY